MEKFKFIVDEEFAGKQVKNAVKQKYKFSSRLMTKFKQQNLIFLNGESVPGWVVCNLGDEVSVKLPEEKSDFPAEDIPIYPVYEDDDLLILNKQPYVTVHPTRGHPEHTIANGLMKYMEDTNQSFKIRFVNRLDRDTTGLLIVAKNSHAQHELTKQMKANTVVKRYKAVVSGIIEEDKFTIDLPIGRPSEDSIKRGVLETGGYDSITHVEVIERFPSGYTLVRLRLETGRTHQIRVHMSHIGHPLLGDWLYEGPCDLFPDRQALHSYGLVFTHPVTGKEISLEAPLPEDMEKLLEALRG